MHARLVALVCLFLSVASVSFAQWQVDGVPIAAVANSQQLPIVIADGAGGAFITWYDLRSGSSDVYAQRVDANGKALWTANGVAISTATGQQSIPSICLDGSGGVVIAWTDSRSVNNDIYAQRVNAAGVPQWTANGVGICVAAGDQQSSQMIPDGAGGAIITWYDQRSGNYDVYARRVDGAGTPQWAVNGVDLVAQTGDQYGQMMLPDGSGGAIIAWYDFRIVSNSDIYVQRINGSGTAQWTFDGVNLCNANNNQLSPTLATDGAGGVIVAWYDNRGATSDIYAQRVSSSGVAQWPSNGVSVCLAASQQTYPKIVADDAGGAIITWDDTRNVAGDIYAQHVNSAGGALWTFDGVGLCTLATDQVSPAITTDGAGGAIITWDDSRTGTQDIYVQHVNGGGTPQWAANGIPASSYGGIQNAGEIVWDGFGGAVVVWQDQRLGGTADIYAQRIEGTYGYWGHPEPTLTSVKDVNHDQGGKVALNWAASGRDRPVPATIDFYSVWRAVDVAAMTVGASSALVTPLENVTREAAPGSHTIAAGYYWELVNTQTATRFPSYSYAAATRADSVLAATGNEFFMIAAHDLVDKHIAFMSNVLSGHSVDNLAPPAPLFLTAQRVGANVNLKWNRVHVPDLRDYSVYRKTSAGVTPIPLNFLSDSEDTILVDASAPPSTLYYIVTAYDVHANQGPKSNEASVSALTGAGNLPPLTALTVLQNYPNPFSGITRFDVGLPGASGISVEVYDVAGRHVRSLSLPQQKSGWQRVNFDGRDGAGRALSSGVYFCRISANGSTVTRKMVIAR